MTITWADRVANLRKALGREPTLEELLDASHGHQVTPAEIEAQRQSFARSGRRAGYGMTTDQITARIAAVTLKIAALKVPGAALGCEIDVDGWFEKKKPPGAIPAAHLMASRSLALLTGAVANLSNRNYFQRLSSVNFQFSTKNRS